MSMPEWLRYALITFGLVLVALAVTGAFARWCIDRRFRKIFPPPMPFMAELPWPSGAPGWRARLKAWLRRLLGRRL